MKRRSIILVRLMRRRAELEARQRRRRRAGRIVAPYPPRALEDSLESVPVVAAVAAAVGFRRLWQRR